MESLGVVPGFMQALTAAQQGAASLISGAYSLVTPAELSSFATALGPLAAGNMIPSMFETTATNVASGMVTAGHHVGLGAATTAAQTSFTAADQGGGSGGFGTHHGESSGLRQDPSRNPDSPSQNSDSAGPAKPAAS